jgi:hypothetical protein
MGFLLGICRISTRIAPGWQQRAKRHRGGRTNAEEGREEGKRRRKRGKEAAFGGIIVGRVSSLRADLLLDRSAQK